MEDKFPLYPLECILDGTRYPGLNPNAAEDIGKVSKKHVTTLDWFVCTYPKSGTTWVQEIMCLLQPDKEKDKKRAERVIFLSGVPTLGLELPPEQAPPVHEGEVNVFKSHFRPDVAPKQLFTKKAKTVVVMRHPKDVAVSFYHFSRSFKLGEPWTRGWDDFLEKFMAGLCLYGDWFKWVKDWWSVKDDSHMLFLSYEWITKNHREAVEQIARCLDVDVRSGQIDEIVTKTTLKTMRDEQLNNCPAAKYIYDLEKIPFFRKGSPGDWKNYFTVAQSEMFDAMIEKELAGYDDLKQFILSPY